ncbi:TPA: hypothetical protein ACFOBB_001748 [Neisseria meningitidis]|nr:hypothetical protein [Neisseria meningitidis]
MPSESLQTALVSQNIPHRFHLAASKYSGLTKIRTRRRSRRQYE